MNDTDPSDVNNGTDWGPLRYYTIMPDVLDSAPDLAAQLRDLNPRLPTPMAWAVATGEKGSFDMDVTCLEFGVSGETGALVWDDPAHGTYVPATGTGTDHRPYWMAGDSDTIYMPPGAVVPVDLVYEAVAEYQRTRQRPACLDWVPGER